MKLFRYWFGLRHLSGGLDVMLPPEDVFPAELVARRGRQPPGNRKGLA
jgi:hypothetical protein